VKEENKKQFHEDGSSKLDQSSFGFSALSFKLKIGYDGKRAANNLTGLGNYSRSLIEYLAKAYPENQYFVYTEKIKANIKSLPVFSLANVSLKFAIKKYTTILWRSFGIKKQLFNDKIDLFHGLSHEIPCDLNNVNIKTVVTIHDLIFLRKPDYYKFIDRIIYKAKSKYACKHADRIIAISEKTKEDIVEFYNIDSEKIDVIYQSCDDSFKKLVSEEEKKRVRKKYQLPDDYILNVGTIEQRKNLLLIIRALPKINTTFKLVIIGKETDYSKLVKKEILNLGLQNRVTFLKNIPFNDLPAIYQLASLFVYPSFYEGFGIPIIEALYGGIPVVAATGSCLEEAGGPNSIYVDPNDVNALKNAINTVLLDEDLQNKMKETGLTYVQKFSNEKVNKQLMSCYLSILSN
jgi:glycosyltransferase involved in cell wall biosynthesis